MSLADMQTRVDQITMDPSVGMATVTVPTAARDKCIDAAIAQYTRDIPRWVLNTAGDGTFPAFVAGQTTYVMPPARWIDGVSTMHMVEGCEVPINKTPPSFLRLGEHYKIQQTSDTDFSLVFLLSAPSGVFRVKFSTAHVLSGAADTTAPIHRDAIAQLAAAYVLRQIATGFAYSNAPILNADVVNYSPGKAAQFKARADDLEKVYHKFIQGDPAFLTAASLFAQQYKNLSWGTGRLLHPRGSWAGSNS